MAGELTPAGLGLCRQSNIGVNVSVASVTISKIGSHYVLLVSKWRFLAGSIVAV